MRNLQVLIVGQPAELFRITFHSSWKPINVFMIMMDIMNRILYKEITEINDHYSKQHTIKKIHNNSYTMIHTYQLDDFYYIATSIGELSFSVVLMQSLASH